MLLKMPFVRDSAPPQRGHLPLAAVLTLAGLSLAAVVVTLGRLTLAPLTTVEAAEANLRMLWPFWIASAMTWASLTALWFVLRRGAGASHGPRWRPTAIVVGVAVAARIIVLAVGEPALSDDVYRYVFDGRNLAHGINPYTVRPQDRMDLATFTEHWPGEGAVLSRMNNPEMTTIYLPASQWVFAATELVVPDARAAPNQSARAHRAVFMALDIVVIALILVALARARRSPWWAALYAWHPLPLAEIAGSGHQESLGIALLLAALLVADRVPRKVWAWTALLAPAVLVKPVVLPVAVLALKGRRWRAWVLCLAVGATVCTAIAAPLWFTDHGEPLRQLLETADRFRLKWAHFGGFYEPLLWMLEHLRPEWTNDRQEVLARRICTALLAMVFAGVWWRGPAGLWGRCRCLMLAMVLLSPTAHPWYLLWALAMVPVAPGLGTWVASLTLAWGYGAWGHVTADGTASWAASPWTIWLAYAPIFGVLAWEAWRRKGLRPMRSAATRGRELR